EGGGLREAQPAGKLGGIAQAAARHPSGPTPALARRSLIAPQRTADVGRGPNEEEPAMLWTIFVILLILWLLGLVSGYTLGGFIHILLVIAVILLILNLLSGRRTVV